MARKYWNLLPQPYFTHKQLATGGRNEILFTIVGCAAYYLFYTRLHRRSVQPSGSRDLLVQGKQWF